MESEISEPKEKNPLRESEEIRKKAREELNRQLQSLLNNQPIENPTEENIEDEVNRLMEEVDIYEKNYIPKDLDENDFNELKKLNEDFDQEEIEDLDEDDLNEIDNKESKEKNLNKININSNINNQIKNKEEKIVKIKKEKNGKKKTNFDMDLDLEDLEDIINKDYKSNDKDNKKTGNITEDKDIKDLMEEYDKKLDKELEKEVEKEFKPKIDIKDVKRAELLLKIDPLINEALIQGRITKDELVLFIDYYEIFSLSNKAKKFTTQQLQAIDDLCYKTNKEKNNETKDEINDKKTKKREKYDLSDENAIDKLTSEIEKGLQDSEEILMKKVDYEKYKMELNKKLNSNKKQDNTNNNKNKNKEQNTLNKNNSFNVSTKTIKTNYTLNENLNENQTNTNNNKDRPISVKSETSTFTQEELMSVPIYGLPTNLKSKSKKDIKSNLNPNPDTQNKTFYKNSQNNKEKIPSQNQKPKTPLTQINKNQSKRNSASSNINSSLSIPSGKKTIPPIKKTKNNINLKSKSNQNVDLFDDDANPINMGKYRGARKDLVKLKMGGKSKMHELFINKPRNLEENEKIKKKFMEFINEGKEDNKNPDVNGNKKSIVRKKIEDAQKFNNKSSDNK